MPRIRKAAAMASDNTCCDNTMEQRLSEDVQSDFRKAIRKFHQAITAGQRNFFNCVNEELFNEVRLSRIRNLTQKAKELLHIVEINLDSDGFWDFPIPDPVPTYIADTMISSDKVDSFAELSQRASQLGFCVTARVVHFVRWGYGMNLAEERFFRSACQSWLSLWTLYGQTMGFPGTIPSLWLPDTMFRPERGRIHRFRPARRQRSASPVRPRIRRAVPTREEDDRQAELEGPSRTLTVRLD